MALSNTTVSTTYQGNGVLVSLPITAAILTNSQVIVTKYDSATTITTELVAGTDYTHPGADPGTSILMTTPPTVNEQITVSRVTPRTQTIDYIGSGSFLAEAHELGLDRIVMMIQELKQNITDIVVTVPVGSGALVRLPDQAVAAAGTITLSSNQRVYKFVQGSGGPTTASTTTPIAAGTVDGQEVRLVGLSAASTLTIVDSGNVSLNGNITLGLNAVLDLCWSIDQSKWIATGRSN